MATIVTRSGKGSALTHVEMDSNFTNLNTELILKPDITTTQTWTAQQHFSEATLVDGATISWDLDTEQTATVTLAGNRTLNSPSNLNAGGTYILRIVQDSTGTRTLGYGSVYKFPSGIAPTLTTDANATDLLSCYSDGTNMYCNMTLDVS